MATRDRDTANREGEKSFLARWSQRKRAAETEAEEKEARKPHSEETAAATGAPGGAAEPDDGKIDPAELPDIDSLDADSDFTVFLKDGVPDALRRRALRKLWRLDPVFGHLDGLNDYDLDYTNAATVVEGLKTVYQVGKGMVLGDDEEKGEEKKEEAAAASADEEASAERASSPAEEADTAEEMPEAAAGSDYEISPSAPTAKTRARKPGDPIVSGAETRRSSAVPGSKRSALQRRWGDPDS